MAKEKAVIRTDMSRFRWTLLEMKKNKVAYLMIAPFFILFALFTIVPVVLSFLLSFTRKLFFSRKVILFSEYGKRHGDLKDQLLDHSEYTLEYPVNTDSRGNNKGDIHAEQGHHKVHDLI
jgi:hypothetical protein